MSRAVQKIAELSRSSEGPLRRCEVLEDAFKDLTHLQAEVLEKTLQDAIDTISHLRRHRQDARRGIVR